MTAQMQDSYGAVSRFNHWLVAIAMIFLLGLGLLLANVELERPLRGSLLGLHKSSGALVLVFGVWRVGYRLIRGFPEPASTMPAWQEWASKAAHWLLLAAIIVKPLSGLIKTVFAGRATDVFGLFTVPAAEKVAWLSSAAGAVHEFAGYFIVAVVVLHVGAALKHHFVDRDATLARMVSGRAIRRAS